MAEYIEREAVIADLELLARYEDSFRQSVILGVVHTIKCKPAADAVPVVHGRWIKNGWNDYSCSMCETQYIGHGAVKWNYCPNCGARMDCDRE